MEHLRVFNSNNLVSAEKTDIHVVNHAPCDQGLNQEQCEALAKWLKEILGNQVEDVEVSNRLTQSPAVLIDRDPYMTAGRKNLLKNMKTAEGLTPVMCNFQINPRHRVIAQLDKTRQINPELAQTVAEQLLDNAKIAAGLLADPRQMLKRLSLLVESAMSACR
jgi:molecular chaperone HtpG